MVPTRGSMRCSVANVRRSSAVDSRGEAASLSVMDVEIGGLGIAEQAGDQGLQVGSVGAIGVRHHAFPVEGADRQEAGAE